MCDNEMHSQDPEVHVAPIRMRKDKGERKIGSHKVKVKLKPGKGNREGCPMHRRRLVEYTPVGSRARSIMDMAIDPLKFPKLAAKVQKLRSRGESSTQRPQQG